MDETVIPHLTHGCDVCDTDHRDLKSDSVDFEERSVMKNQACIDEALSYSISVPTYLMASTDHSFAAQRTMQY